MKTRVSFVEVTVVVLNPVNGWDANIPDKLYGEYIAAFRKFDEVASLLGNHLLPKAELAYKAVMDFYKRNGLSLLPTKGQP